MNLIIPLLGIGHVQITIMEGQIPFHSKRVENTLGLIKERQIGLKVKMAPILLIVCPH